MSGWPASSRLSALLARAAHVVAEFNTGGSGTEGRSGESLNSRLGPEAVTASLWGTGVVADGEADRGRTGCESTTLCSAAGPLSGSAGDEAGRRGGGICMLAMSCKLSAILVISDDVG